MACHGLGAPGGAGPENKNVVLVIGDPRQQRSGREPRSDPSRLPRHAQHRPPSLGTDPEYGSWRRQFYESNREERSQSRDAATRIPSRHESGPLREQDDAGSPVRDRSLSLKPSKDFNFTLSERNTPALFGAGRIDAIPSEVLVAVAAAAAGRGPGPGQPHTGRAGSAGSAGRRRSPACTSSSGRLRQRARPGGPRPSAGGLARSPPTRRRRGST